MLTRCLFVVILACVTSHVAGHWGDYWAPDTDTNDACTGCYEYCNVTNSAGEVTGGCVCPDGFTCTVAFSKEKKSGWWRKRKSETMTYSKCARDVKEPDHMGPPCMVTKGEDMYNISCPAGFDCDVGPVTSVTGYSITYCNYATTDDVSTDAWWAWFCEANNYSWRHWCSDDDWWGTEGGYKGFSWWRRCSKW